MYFFEISVIICAFIYFIFEIVKKAHNGSIIYNISGTHVPEAFISQSGAAGMGMLNLHAGKKKKSDDEENGEEYNDDDDFDDDLDDDWDEKEDDPDDEEWEEELIKSKNKQGNIC